MSTTHHTAITTGAAANAATVNNPLGELDAAIVAADLTEGGDIDGTLGISETTIPTRALLAVGGGISVTDGAGSEKAFIDENDASIGEYIIFEELPELPAGDTLTIDLVQTNALNWYAYNVVSVDLTIHQANSGNGIALSEKLIIQAKANANGIIKQTLYSANEKAGVTYTQSLITGGIRYSITNTGATSFGASSRSAFIIVKITGQFQSDFSLSTSVA